MKNSTKWVSERKTIDLTDSLAYDLYPVGQRGKIPTLVVILCVLFFFPLGVLLCILNICSKDPVYLFTVYKKDHQICKHIVGVFKYTQTKEKLRRLKIPQSEGY